MNETKIEWTDFTSNPLKYRNANGENTWACVKTSPGCLNCYAEKMSLSTRFRPKGFQAEPFTAENMRGLTPFMDDKELRQLLTSKKISGKRVFVGDMTDLFGEWVPFEFLDRLFAVMALRPDVTFQLLTKRAERMREYIHGITELRLTPIMCSFEKLINAECAGGWGSRKTPLPNVWLGVSCENRAQLHRLDVLKDVPAAVRFVSFEPLLEDLGTLPDMTPFGWSILGGESGPGKRPIQADWMRSIRDQCHAAGAKVFCKQMDKVQPLPLDLMACREFPSPI